MFGIVFCVVFEHTVYMCSQLPKACKYCNLCFYPWISISRDVQIKVPKTCYIYVYVFVFYEAGK